MSQHTPSNRPFDADVKREIENINSRIESIEHELIQLKAKRDALKEYLGMPRDKGRGGMHKGSLARQAYDLLQSRQEPMHVKEIAACLGDATDSVFVNKVRSVMGRNRNFEIVEPGVYRSVSEEKGPAI